MDTLRGIALSGDEFKKSFHQFYKPKASYTWDTGFAVGRYLAGLKDGILWGIRCGHCGTTRIPPRSFCSECFKPIYEWVELKDTGRVNTFSISYITWDVKRVETPTLPAVIDIDGTSPASGILHILDEVDPKDVKIGMRVKAVWKPLNEREGAITDIRYWKPY